jgi:hypothetical protein
VITLVHRWGVPRTLAVALVVVLAFVGPRGPVLSAVLALALLYQVAWIVPYLPLAPVPTQLVMCADAEAMMRIFLANVLTWAEPVQELTAPDAALVRACMEAWR